MDVRLDDDAMKGIITKAIVDSLTPERREQLIAEAVRDLLTKTDGNRYGSQSKLAQAFSLAVETVAREIASEELAKDGTMREKIKGLMVAGWEKMIAEDAREKLIDSIASGMRKTITGDRY